MRVRENDFDQAAERFYEAAAIPELWPGALQAMADACGATGAIIFPVHAGPSVPYPSPGIEEVVHDLVTEGWGSANSRMQRGLALTRAGMKGLITDTDMFTREELARDPLYNEFLVPHGMSSTAGMVLARAGREFVFPIAFERQSREGAFFRPEIALMNRLVEKIQPAAVLALNAGLATARRIVDGLSHSGSLVLLIGPSGHVIHVPPSLETHLRDGLVVRDRFLRANDARSDRLLTAAVARAVSVAPVVERVVAAFALPRMSGRPLLVEIVPIAGAGQDVFMLARAAVIVTDPDVTRPPDRAMKALIAIGLTPAEARLALAIGRGEDLKAIADRERIAAQTARARLKSVFAKTDTHRQSQLAAFVGQMLH